ncbi:hypothetical protein [Alteribacter natronophilus]|nr:hypothetical protein [Alteribacter natronophilus]
MKRSLYWIYFAAPSGKAPQTELLPNRDYLLQHYRVTRSQTISIEMEGT